jgi:uncharacterized membrane protein YkvA (DUF1232 family)
VYVSGRSAFKIARLPFQPQTRLLGGPGLFESWKQRAHALKVEILALSLAYRHPATPWFARLFVALLVAYAFSPIDLIPDPVPVLGYLDDLIILPLGILLALKLIPPQVMAECRQAARLRSEQDGAGGWRGAALVILLWILAIGLLLFLFWRWRMA